MQRPTATAQPDTTREVYELATKTLKAGDIAEAELICRRAFPKHRDDPNINCLLGEINLRLRRPQEAQSWYGKALRIQKAFPRALEGMGLALLADKRAAEAVDFLKKASVAAPKRSITQSALGRALSEAGHRDESEHAMREAIKLNPALAELGKAEVEQQAGNIEQAEKTLRSILAKDADNIKAIRMLANIALEANRFRAARKMLERALELNPNFALAWNDLGNVFLKQDRYEKALEMIDKAISIDPEFTHSHVMRGNILTKAQRHEESLAAYQQALDVTEHSVGALAGMGHVLKTIGRSEESIAAYRQCIKKHPAYGEAYWSLANLKTFEFDTEEVEVMQTMVEREHIPDETKVNFFLSIGKHFENEKDFDKAFEHYRLGNELRRSHEIYDPVQTQVVHDRIIDVFNSEFLQERESWGDPDAAPILIVGLPRSGSTLIEQILASHSMVEGTMELPDLARMISGLSKREKKGRIEYPEAISNLDEEGIRDLGRSYIESTSRFRSDKIYFIDKMPNNFPSIGFLHLILPNAQVINARRHPLYSCMCSFKQRFYKGQSWSYDQFEIGQYYLQYQRIMDHWHEVLPGKVLDVHYEDMVTDQENQTRRLLEHLGLPWEDQVLRFYETERAVNTASSEQVRQPIYTKALNHWRNYESQLEELIEILEPLLKELPEESQPSYQA